MNEAPETDWARIDAMTDEDIDFSDNPALTEEILDRMQPRYPSPVQITLAIDPKTAAWFQTQGDSVDEQMAEVLRIYAESHRQTAQKHKTKI